MTSYEVSPLTLTPQKAEKILNEAFRVDGMFNDYQPACDEMCGYCALCMNRKRAVAKNMWNLQAAAWEVWSEEDLVGILFVRDITDRTDGFGEFLFWDGDLRGKRDVIENVIERAIFGDLGLHRITIELSDKEETLIKFLKRKLGFEEEGRKREAMRWHGEWRDVVLLGRVNGNGAGGDDAGR